MTALPLTALPLTTQRLAIIPARGGSKGIPRKNLAPVGGRPLVAWTIDHALTASSVERVVVSTDDDEIAAVSRSYGAEVVMRPAELAGDEAGSESALLHVLNVLAADEGYEPDQVVFLQATSPLRHPDDVDRAVALLEESSADSLFSGCPVHGFVWRQGGDSGGSDSGGSDGGGSDGGKKKTEVRALTYDPANRPRRQDIGNDYLENGSIYVTRTAILRREGNRLGGRIVVYPMDPLASFQVDEPSDIELFEKLLALDLRPSSA